MSVAVDPEATEASISGLDVLEDMRSSAGQARDMTNPQLDALRVLFADPDVGLWWFCRVVFKFHDMVFDFHGKPCQLVGHWGESHLADGRIIHHTPKGGYEEDNVIDSYRRIMMRIPRETFKTSCFTRAASLRKVAIDTLHPDRTDPTIGIFNETQDKPIQWIDAIRQVAENSDLFQMCYADILPKGISFWDREAGITTSRKLKWGGTGMRFERSDYGISELSIEPHGITGTAVGKHFTHMIWDDIIGLKAAQSIAIMEQAFEWVDNSRPLERPAEGGCVLVPHTTWAYHDVYKHMEQRWPGEWKIYHRALLENPDTGEPDDVFGVSTIPSKISTKKAYRMKAADEYIFSAQYQCFPKAGKGQSFREEHNGAFHIIWEGQEPVIKITRTGSRTGYDGMIFEYDMAEPPDAAPDLVPLSWCSKSILIDPAPSKPSEMKQNRNANNALVVAARDPWGRCFNLDVRISKAGPTEVMEEVVSLARIWQAWTWSVEEVVFSAVYQPLWSRIMSLDPQFEDCGAVEWHPLYPKGRDKHDRIKMNLIAPHESGLMYYNMGPPEDLTPGFPSAYLLKEMKEFPHGDTVDTLDAWSYILESIEKPETPDAIYRAAYRAKSEEASRGITGYGEITWEDSP